MNSSALARPAALLEREVERVRARCAPWGSERGGLVIEGEAGDGEVAAARGGGRRASASASWRRGRQSSSKGSRSGSCGSSSSAHCWRPKATSATVGWREQRRWLRTCSPERRRRRRGRRRQAQPPAIPATRGNTACTGSPPTSPLIRRTHNEPTASGRPDHGASGAARCPGAQDRQIRTSVRGSTSPALAGVLPRHTGPCRRAISDACESNLRPSPYLQKVSGSNDHKKPANSCFKCTPAEDRIRQSAISPQLRRRTTRLMTRKKTCKRRPFRKRLMGFEPTTFCMASRRSSQLSYSRRVA